MDLIPIKVDGAVVLNYSDSCGANLNACGICGDFPIAIHNFMQANGLPYIILDLQDEKLICNKLIEETLFLWRRLRCPLHFCGVMPRPKTVLESYAFPVEGNVFDTPEDAVAHLFKNQPSWASQSFEGIQFGKPLGVAKPRHSRVEESLDEGEAE